MERSNLMECGRNFALCKHITVFEFLNCHKCHKCHKYNDKYKQNVSIDRYNILIKAPMTFELDIVDDSHSMISIFNDKSIAPELYQILKENNKYTYVHFERDAHKILEKHEVDPLSFTPDLNPNQKHEANLIYGPHVIFIHE